MHFVAWNGERWSMPFQPNELLASPSGGLIDREGCSVAWDEDGYRGENWVALKDWTAVIIGRHNCEKLILMEEADNCYLSPCREKETRSLTKGELMKYDSTKDTTEHINKVKNLISWACKLLTTRGQDHDASKLISPEKEIFDIVTPKLSSLTYGSDEYKDQLKSMGEALAHHYQQNRHHPEHFSNGISGMTLIDVMEMFLDWCAATYRHDDGSIGKSIAQQEKKLNLPQELVHIFLNTAEFHGIGCSSEQTTSDYQIAKGQ